MGSQLAPRACPPASLRAQGRPWGERGWDPHAGHQQPGPAGRQALEGRLLAGRAGPARGSLRLPVEPPAPAAGPASAPVSVCTNPFPGGRDHRALMTVPGPHAGLPGNGEQTHHCLRPPAGLLMGEPREGQPSPRPRHGWDPPARPGLPPPPPRVLPSCPGAPASREQRLLPSSRTGLQNPATRTQAQGPPMEPPAGEPLHVPPSGAGGPGRSGAGATRAALACCGREAGVVYSGRRTGQPLGGSAQVHPVPPPPRCLGGDPEHGEQGLRGAAAQQRPAAGVTPAGRQAARVSVEG